MYYLAIDTGASRGRHIIGSVENGKLVIEEMYRFPTGTKKKNSSLGYRGFGEPCQGGPCRLCGQGKIFLLYRY